MNIELHFSSFDTDGSALLRNQLSIAKWLECDFLVFNFQLRARMDQNNSSMSLFCHLSE